MASAVIFATIVIVVSAANYERRPFLHYSEYLQKALPNHWQHDKEELNRHVESLTRLHQVAAKPARPPLRDPAEPEWTKWARDHRWRPNTNKELQNVRKRLLQEKLRLNYLMPRRANIPPQPRPDADRKHVRHKREVDADQPVERNDRAKRHVQPEVVMQPHIQAPLSQNQDSQGNKPGLSFHFYNPSIYYPEVIDSLSNKTGPYQDKVNEKRDKRQILVLINQQQPLMFVKSPRTTPNPFIRETNIDDYEIIHPNPGEGYRPEPGMGKDSEVDSYQLRVPQALIQLFKNTNLKIGQSYPIESVPIDKAKEIKEETHIRVKRKMSKFRRDRKQITRKKKIGRRKKTKVRKAPIKIRRWYDKRQKKPKKGDGTYRGGRGRIPRQHKRPRNFKPPQNETSDYDYYDEDGNIRVPSGETQEGSDDAAYVSYGTGEYSDTEEAERAHQQLEKEYQMQLVKDRKRAERRRLSNGTIESSEEIKSLPLIESKSEESETETDEESGEEEDDEEYESEYEDESEEESEEETEEESEEDQSGSNDSDGGGAKDNKKGPANKKDKGGKKNTKKAVGKIQASNALNMKSKENGYEEKGIYNDGNALLKDSDKNTHPAKDAKSKSSQDIRLAAKKFNFVSQSTLPGVSNLLNIRNDQPPNKMSSVKFESPKTDVFSNLKSMSLPRSPDVFSIAGHGVVSKGGESLQNLQSKRVFSKVQSKSSNKKVSLTSTARDKSENPLTFTSKSKDKLKMLTSVGSEHMKTIQSLTIDPLVLTSIAKHIPELEADTKSNHSVMMDGKAEEESQGTPLKGVKDSLRNINSKSTPQHLKSKTISQNTRGSKITDHKLHLHGSEEYEELSEIPDDVNSIPSDEVESAPDDKLAGKNQLGQKKVLLTKTSKLLKGVSVHDKRKDTIIFNGKSKSQPQTNAFKPSKIFKKGTKEQSLKKNLKEKVTISSLNIAKSKNLESNNLGKTDNKPKLSSRFFSKTSVNKNIKTKPNVKSVLKTSLTNSLNVKVVDNHDVTETAKQDRILKEEKNHDNALKTTNNLEHGKVDILEKVHLLNKIVSLQYLKPLKKEEKLNSKIYRSIPKTTSIKMQMPVL